MMVVLLCVLCGGLGVAQEEPHPVLDIGCAYWFAYPMVDARGGVLAAMDSRFGREHNNKGRGGGDDRVWCLLKPDLGHLKPRAGEDTLGD